MTVLSRLPRPDARPLLTFYDLDTGERVELSGTTTANWVDKTANFLTEELDAEPGTRLRLALPSHWLRCVWLLASWRVGVVVCDASTPDAVADVGVSGPTPEGDELHRVACSLRPLGAPFAEPPAGFLDMALEVPPQPDAWLGLVEPVDDLPALDLTDGRLTHAELADLAGSTSARTLLTGASVRTDALALVAAATGGGSLVIAVGGDAADVDRVAGQEGAVVV